MKLEKARKKSIKHRMRRSRGFVEFLKKILPDVERYGSRELQQIEAGHLELEKLHRESKALRREIRRAV